MKRNFGLFLVLIVLLVVTYFFQERRDQIKEAEEEQKSRVLKEEVSSLAWGDWQAIKKNDQWWMGETLLSHNLLKQIEKKISEIAWMKDLPGENQRYFSDPFSLVVNGKKWTFGDMTLEKDGFYLQLGEKFVIAYVHGESTGFAQNENEIEEMKLLELKQLLSQDPKENQLFRFYPNLPLDKMQLEADGMLTFELDLVGNKTLPPPIAGIKEQEKLKEKVLGLLTQMTIKEEIKTENFFKKIATLKLSSPTDSVTWEMWLRTKDSAEAVLTDTKSGKSYLMIGGTLKVFFVQIQDYWDKKIIPSSAFNTFDRLNLQFVQGKRSARVTVINKEPLEFESTEAKVKTASMDAFIRLLFNLAEYDQAQRVSQLTASERQQFLNEENLRLELMEQDLLVKKKKEELIVANLTQGFKAHFHLQDEKSLGRFEDVLE